MEQNVEQWSEHVFETRLVRLMMTEPFWASVLRGVERVKTTKIPTAMVFQTEGSVILHLITMQAVGSWMPAS